LVAGRGVRLVQFACRYYRRGEANGEVNGTRRMLLAVLVARGIEVSYEARTPIDECDDPGQLESWGRRAALAESIDDLFDGSVPKPCM
jgi:hypothetical protein